MKQTLKKLGIESNNSGTFDGSWSASTGPEIASFSPIDGCELAKISTSGAEDYERVIAAATDCFAEWRMFPAPKRGEVVREIADALRDNKQALGELVTLEMGKILPEGLGEVQEAIDIADFAVGLSRQLYGKTMHSERSLHRMYEQWHPLGNVGVITAFNFPVAVWAWNAMIAAVCGDTVVWKPSELTPLCALAVTKIVSEAAERHGFPALFTLLTGDGPSIGQRMAADRRFPLISATGSCAMGRSVGETVAKRLGRSLLELGGNNAVVVLEDADIDLVVRAVLFGAVGTAGQRCTSTRRLIVHKSIADEVTNRLLEAYRQVQVGNPLESSTLMGPLVNEKAVDGFKSAVARIENEGGEILFGGSCVEDAPSSLYVSPTLVKAKPGMPLLQQETFAPILYVLSVDSLDEAIRIHNGVDQGLSSAIFTSDVRSAEKFLSHVGSDCGIANVNIGTSGAEIGGAFGGEKDTGGGREAGSDSWKAYMRRQTNTINWGKDLPLAQGIEFG